MHFVTEAVPAEVAASLPRFLGIAGWPAWQRCDRRLRAEMQAHPCVSAGFEQTFELELQILRLRNHLAATGRMPKEWAHFFRACQFISSSDRVYRRLSEHARKRFGGMMRDCLANGTYGLAPLEAEVSMVVHLLNRGLAVFCNDLEIGHSFDLLALINDKEIEIDVKWTSGDVGRSIHKRKLYELGKHIHSKLGSLPAQIRGGHLVRLTLPDRLHGNHAYFENVAERVARVLRGDAPFVSEEICSVHRTSFALEGSPFVHRPGHLTPGEVRQFAERQMPLDGQHVICSFEPGRCAVVIAARSARPDQVLPYLIKQLKRSAERQFSKTRPAVLVVHLGDVAEPQLRHLADGQSHERAKAPALQLAVNDFLMSDERQHVAMVAFTAPGRPRSSVCQRGGVDGNLTAADGLVLHFTNPAHPAAGFVGRALFGPFRQG